MERRNRPSFYCHFGTEESPLLPCHLRNGGIAPPSRFDETEESPLLSLSRKKRRNRLLSSDAVGRRNRPSYISVARWNVLPTSTPEPGKRLSFRTKRKNPPFIDAICFPNYGFCDPNAETDVTPIHPSCSWNGGQTHSGCLEVKRSLPFGSLRSDTNLFGSLERRSTLVWKPGV